MFVSDVSSLAKWHGDDSIVYEKKQPGRILIQLSIA